MRELEDKIIFHIRDMQASGKLDELIKVRLESCVASILDETLRSYGTFGRELANKMSAALAVDLDDLGIGGYQAMVAEVIKSRIDTALTGEWKAQLEASIDDILRAAPRCVKLSELLRGLVEDHKDDAELAGTLRGMNRYLFRLQAGGTVIELDLAEGEHSREYEPEEY